MKDRNIENKTGQANQSRFIKHVKGLVPPTLGIVGVTGMWYGLFKQDPVFQQAFREMAYGPLLVKAVDFAAVLGYASLVLVWGFVAHLYLEYSKRSMGSSEE